MAAANIHVCALNEMERTVRENTASHVISLINQAMMPPTPTTIDSSCHLKLAMNDIGFPADGFISPSVQHVEELIDFVESWSRQTDLVFHCWAGISRSTAAAFISLCHLNPDSPEGAIAQMIRFRSPTAAPNRLLINCADKLLGRSGRLIEAIEALGRPALATTGTGVPFSVCADLREKLNEANST